MNGGTKLWSDGSIAGSSSGSATIGAAVSPASITGRSPPKVAITSSPSSPPVADTDARIWLASAPRRSVVTSIVSTPAGTGEQNTAVADSGRTPVSSPSSPGRSPSSAAIARNAIVTSTPPDGMK